MLKRFGAMVLVGCVGAIGHPPVQAATVTVAGSNLGIIPDGNPAGRAVNFAIPALGAPVVGVSVSMTLSHTWAGDIEATLISPGGFARTVVFSRTGINVVSTTGDSSNFSGTYRFSDSGSLDLWAQAAAVPGLSDILPGHYRAVSRGTSASNAGGCPTSLDGVFGGLTSAQATGTWTLQLVDRSATDEGSIGAAALTVEFGVAETLFANSFEAVAPLRCANKVVADFDGDGRSDYVLVRANAGQVEWHVRSNLGGGTAATETTFPLGSFADSIVDTFDFDGDRIADAAAWAQTTGSYSIRLSSRLGSAAPTVVVHGQLGDDPLQSGDYDGDGQDDLAVLRQPVFGAGVGPVQMLVRKSSNGQVVSLPLGSGAANDQFVVGGFDYTGDALVDVAVQRTDSVVPTMARFTYYDGRSVAELSSFLLGVPSDAVVAGSYVGDARSDITVSRTVSGTRVWDTRDSATGAVTSVSFSILNDNRVLGDYDGDGLSDHAVWRSSATPNASQFVIRPSTAPATTWMLVFGVANDVAVAGTRLK